MTAYVCDFAACSAEATAEASFEWTGCGHAVPGQTAWVCDGHPAQAERATACRVCGGVSVIRTVLVAF